MKKNNKGFSLVELIVVVLIMAIIAVALAPQVMKWVENSRISTDCSNYEEMILNLQTAIIEKNAYKEAMNSAKVTVKIDGSGTTMSAASGTTCTAIDAEMDKVAPGWEKIQKKATDKGTGNNDYYTIEIYNGAVFRAEQPKKNDDLS